MPRDAKRPNVGVVQRHKNLDVVETSRDQENLEPKDSAGESRPNQHLSVVCPFPAQLAKQHKHRGPYRTHGSKYISVPQATNIIEEELNPYGSSVVTEAELKRALRDCEIAATVDAAGDRLRETIRAFYVARKDRRIKK